MTLCKLWNQSRPCVRNCNWPQQTDATYSSV